MANIRVRLRIGIAVMFLAIVLPLTIAMISVLYTQNASLARAMATDAMAMSGRQAATTIYERLQKLSSAVEMSVAFGRAQQDGLRKVETLRPLMEQLERLPEAYSLYFGQHADGEFFQIIQLPGDMKKFGPHQRPPPEGTRWVLRTIDDANGERVETYLYLAAWGKVLRVERAEPTYDPRKRPWYSAALAEKNVASSGVYVFSSTGQPGLTLSKRLTTEDGVHLGVFGADITINALASFLDKQRVGQSGLTFILDEERRLIGYPDAGKILSFENGAPKLVKGEDIDVASVAQAIKAYNAGTGDSFSVNVEGKTWLAHFEPFPEQSGRKWVIGVIADEDDFVGPLKRASLIIVVVGLVFILLATLGIVWLSRVLVRPIQRLIRETERIREFKLEKTNTIQSPVMEIDALAAAVASMKAGLASFGTYIPKSLVHNIIRSGRGTGVGGQRRPLTVMFSDLQGFTEASESMEPEEVLQWLSNYFEQMSSAIHAHSGTIDKYIGDAIMAIWNAPVDDADHVANACRALLACRLAAHSLGNNREGPHLRTRIGLHTGVAMVGNVGSSDRMQYTALGSMVNLASRIEGLNKQFGTEILVTEAVVKEAGDRFHFRPFGPVLVVGASIPLSVFELVSEADAPPADLADWLRAFDAWQAQDWASAAQKFEAYLSAHPGDLAAQRFVSLAQGFAEQGPPADWDGVIQFTSK